MIKLYKLLLHLYPDHDRRTFGPEMVFVFQQAEAHTRGKTVAHRSAFYIREFSGLLADVFRLQTQTAGRSHEPWPRSLAAPKSQFRFADATVSRMVVIFGGVVLAIRMASGIAGDTSGAAWTTLISVLVFMLLSMCAVAAGYSGGYAPPAAQRLTSFGEGARPGIQRGRTLINSGAGVIFVIPVALFSAIALIAQRAPQSDTAMERVASPLARDIQQSLRFVPGRMAHYHVPGLSIVCIHNGAIAWMQAFGLARGVEPVTPETLFQASSISMPLTAVAVLRLVDQGKLNLDVDVSQYLRSWNLSGSGLTEQSKVTLRELLSHTAGATVHGFGGYNAGEKVPTLVQVLNGQKPANSAPVTIDFAPGTKFQYAGGNYAIVQQILTDVRGESFPDLMQELVLQPLHMGHSTFQQPLPEKLRPLAADPYDQDGHAIKGGSHIYPEMAVAGLWSTPSDLALFALAIQDALAGKPGAILPSSTAHEMLRPVLGFYALGFSIAGSGPSRYFSHPGANAGFLSFLFAYEKGDGVVMMANSQYSKALMLEIIQALSKQYGWIEFPRGDRFSNTWVIASICACIVLFACLLYRAIRHRRSRAASSAHKIPTDD